ncbi:Gfo/Idh/MocA family protein [Candidatus Sodalis sp. SoCistrobi]|uniref:Gfo/Idh/MocA family protein n=1 Tax=Candidatus Sodalis sp. SoCistrobi TaxID=1922216 RepID=UPI00093E18D7|nr:Gfo/Idh/MocA family oxidoreductase [Candidatus Sodalis sp. SoCistrobi]
MKYVIVGTGNISGTYADALRAVAGCELTGFISRRQTRHGPAGQPSLPCWPTLADVDEPFDAVIIATPNGLHPQSAIEAACLGKHILVEKPLAITVAAMDSMMDAARQHGVTLAVSFQRLSYPDNLAVKALLARGALGQIYSADLSCRFWRDQPYYDSADYRGGYRLDGGGVFMQQASHAIDTYIWLFGMPAQLHSELPTFAHRMEAEDHGAVVMRYDNGMIGTIVASTCARPGYPPRLEVCCEKGTFTLSNDCIEVWHIDGIDNPAHPPPPVADNGASSATLNDSRRHQAILADFEQAVARGSVPLAAADDARRATELILHIYQQHERKE